MKKTNPNIEIEIPAALVYNGEFKCIYTDIEELENEIEELMEEDNGEILIFPLKDPVVVSVEKKILEDLEY